MSSQGDISLPLHEASSLAPLDSATAWGLERIEPSDLLLLWPAAAGEAAPAFERVLEALARHCGEKPQVIDPSLPRPDSHTVWTAMIRLPNHGEVVIWAEPMRALPAKTVEALKIDGVKWLVGIETV